MIKRNYEFRFAYKKPGRKNLAVGKKSSVYLDYLAKSDYSERAKIFYKQQYLAHFYDKCYAHNEVEEI